MPPPTATATALPPTDTPAPPVEEHTELRDAIQAPQEKARAAQQAIDEAAAAQRKAIEAAEAGTADRDDTP